MTSPRGTNLKGLNLPSTGCLWGADSTNFASGTHAIEAAYTGGGSSPTTTGGLGRQMAIRRRHYTGSSWGTASGSEGNLTFGNNSSSGHALGVDEKADALLGLVPCIVLGSQGNTFPIVARGPFTDGGGKSVTAPSTNTYVNSNGKAGMNRIANGEFDSSFTTLANTLASIVDPHGNPSPVMIILWQEMDAPAMNCYGRYQGTGNGSNDSAGTTAYKNAFAHVAGIIHANAPNAIVGFCPTFFDPDGNKTDYFPGTPAVDWVWEDLYDHNMSGNIDDLYNIAVTNGLPYGIAESGMQGDASGATIIAEHQATAKNSTYEGNLLAYLLWSFTGPGGDNTYYHDLAYYQAYEAFATDNYFASLPSIGSGGGGTAPSGGSPSLSDDTPAVAQGISCSPGTWSGTTPITFTYQWQVSATGTGSWASATGTGNATQNYTVGTVDLAQFLRCHVTATNSVGSATANSEVSSAVTNVVSSTLPSESPDTGVPQGDGNDVYKATHILGSIYVGGDFTTFGGSTRNHFAAYSESGSLLAWNPNANGDGYKIIPGPSGKVFVSGAFTTINGVSRSRVALISSDTSVASPTVDTTFIPPTINALVTGMAYDPSYGTNGALYIAGDFTTIGSSSRTYFACLDAGTGALLNWNVNITNVNVNYHPGRRIMLGKHASDPGVYIVGAFDTVNGVNMTGIACLANDPSNSSPALAAWRPDVQGQAGTGTDSGTQGHDMDIKPDGTKLIVSYSGSAANGWDGNHGVAYQLIASDGVTLSRQNTRLWTSSVTGDSGDHNACGCDDTYCAFGHHGNGSSTNPDGLGNPKCYIVEWTVKSGSGLNAIPTPSGWVVNTLVGAQGVYTCEFSSDRFLIGGNLTAPRTGLVQFDRTSVIVTSTPQVGIVYFENATRAGAISGSANMAAFDSKYMSFTDHEGVSNPSCPDYTATTCGDLPIAQNQGTVIGTFGGSPQGIDAPSAGVGWAGNLHNLFDQLSTAGFKWKTYEEGPSVQTSGWNPGDAALTDTPQCATRHSPGAFYTTPSTTIGSAHGQGRYTFTELTHDISNSSLPDFFWISPGNYHAGHMPGDITTANTWMGSPTSGMLANIIAAMKPNGILIISFDNVPTMDTTPPITGTGVVYCVVAGQNVPHSTVSTYYTHYSITKGIQNLFGVATWTGSVDPNYTSVAAMVLPNVGGGISGSGAGSVAFTGTAAGRIGIRGTATGSVAITGLGAGRVSLSRGTAYTAVSFTGQAIGQVIGQAIGSMAGTAVFTGLAAGTIEGTFLGTGVGSVSFTGHATGHITGRSGTCSSSATFTGLAGGQIITSSLGQWWKVINNGGRGNGVIPDPNQIGRALGIGDVFGHHTTADNGHTWYARQKGVTVNIGGTAIVYGRTGIWSIKHPGRAYLGLGTLKNGLNANAKIIDLSGGDPYAQTILPVGSLSNLSFGTNMQDPTPDGTKAAECMPRMGTGHLMDVYYTGSGSEYLFGAHNAGIARWVDEGSPTNLVTGTYTGGSVSTPGWKALIVHVESGGVPVIYAATYGLGGWTGSVIRITNILSGTPSVTTLSAAPNGVNDFSIDDSGNLYACGLNHIWQITNSGTTWTAIDGGATSGRTVGSLDVVSTSGGSAKPVFGFNSGTTGNNVWTPASTALGGIAGWRSYLTPGQGIPSTYPGNGQTIPTGVTLPVVSPKPDVPTFINGTTLDASFKAWCALAPAGAWITLWHEGESNDGWTAAQIVALHKKAYTLAKAANPNILYGQIVVSASALPGAFAYPLPAWIATQADGVSPLDFYGLDSYAPNLAQHTLVTVTEAAVAAIQSVVPTARFAITEANAVSVNAASPNNHTQGTSDPARAGAFRDLYAYAKTNNFLGFFPFYFVSTDNTDNYPWDASDTATINELTAENADTKTASITATLVAGMSDFPDTTQKSILTGTFNSGTWSWNWMPVSAVKTTEYNNGHTYWLNAGYNVLGGNNFSTSSIRFDADGQSVYLAGMQGMWKSDDLFNTVYPAGDGFGGSESQYVTNVGGVVGDFQSYDTDWNGETTSDGWTHYATMGTSPSGTNVQSVTVGGHTYTINAVTPIQIIKDGTTHLENDYVQGSCVSIMGIAGDTAGTLSIALWGGGILRYIPGNTQISGTAASLISFIGQAAGHVIKRGVATSTVSFTGLAAGISSGVHSGAGSVTFTGHAAGVTSVSPHMIGNVAFTGSATGHITAKGVATGQVAITGVGVGQGSIHGSNGQWVKNLASEVFGTNQASLTVPLIATPSIGNMISVAVQSGNTTSISSVTDNASNVYTVDLDTDGVSIDCVRFVTAMLAGIPTSVTVTMTSATAQWVVVVDEWEGVTNTTPRIDASVTAQASGTNTTPTVQSGIANGVDLGIALFGYESGAGGGQKFVSINLPFTSVSSDVKSGGHFTGINVAQTPLQPGIANLRSLAQHTLTNATSLTFGPPAGARSGDLIFVMLTCEGDLPFGSVANNYNMILPSGWAPVGNVAAGGEGLTNFPGVAYRASYIPYDPNNTSYTWAWTGATNGQVSGRLTVYALTGVNLANPLDTFGPHFSPSGSPWTLTPGGSLSHASDLLMFWGYNITGISGSAGPTLTDAETPTSIASSLWAFSAYDSDVLGGAVASYVTNLTGSTTTGMVGLAFNSVNPAAISTVQASGTMSGAVTGWHVTTLGYQALGQTTLVGGGVGNITFTGSATGHITAKGVAASHPTFTGTAVGKIQRSAIATGTVSFTGTAAGSATLHTTSGTATGVVVFTGVGSSTNARLGADSGVGSEVSTLAFHFPRVDSGQGMDISTQHAALTRTDSGTG